MLRLAAKLMAFFWRRADGPEEMAGLQGLELLEGASWGGAGARWGRGGRAGAGVLTAYLRVRAAPPRHWEPHGSAPRSPSRVRAAFRSGAP